MCSLYFLKMWIYYIDFTIILIDKIESQRDYSRKKFATKKRIIYNCEVALMWLMRLSYPWEVAFRIQNGPLAWGTIGWHR